MPANGQVSTSGMVDTQATCLVPQFNQPGGSGASDGTAVSFPYSYASEVHLRVGREASTAEIFLPMNSQDEVAPAVAGVKSSPLTNIKIGTNVMVAAAGANLLVGCVTKINQSLYADTAHITVQDYRYLLAGMRIRGRFVAGGTGGTTFSYQQGWRAHFNPPHGANCTLGEGGVPFFCTPNYGLGDGEQPASTLTAGKASYWNTVFILQYLQYCFANSAALAHTTQFPTYTQIDSRIVWPLTYGNGIENSDDGTSTILKARELDLEGMRLDIALSTIIEMAGHYGLYMVPGTGYTNTLVIRPTRYKSSTGGITLGRAAGGAASGTLNDSVAIDGTISEDGSEMYTMMTAAGELVYIEQRLDSFTSVQLTPAWSTADETALKAYVIAPPGSIVQPKTLAALQSAFSQYPRVYAAWRIDPAYNFQAGSDQTAFPKTQIGRAPLPHLLSSFLEGSSATQADLTNTRRAIRFELSSDGTTWYEASEHDGLQIDEEGTIWIPGLRQLGSGASLNYGSTWSGDYTADPSTLVKNYIRATLAIPCDHRLEQNLKISTDPTPNIGVSPDNDDADRIDPTLSRFFYADSAQLYAYDQRVASWPVPQTAAKTGTTALTGILRNDTSFLQAHLKKRLGDLGRINRTGRLIFPHIRVGVDISQMIASIDNVGIGGNFPIRACVNEVIFKCGKETNSTELVLN